MEQKIKAEVINMPASKSKRKSVTVSLSMEDYEYIQHQLEVHGDTVRSVSRYIRRLVHHYLLCLRAEEEIRKRQCAIKEYRELEGQNSED